MPNHKMVFRFTDANGTIVFTNWVVSHANDGNYFYVGAVPSHPGNSTAAWTSLCVILYSTSSTSPSSDYSAAGTAYGSSPRTLAMTPEITAIAQKGTSVGTLPSGTVTSGTLNEISITSATSLPNPSVQANVIPTIQTYFASHWDTKSSDFDRMSFWCGDQFLPDTDVCCSAISNATTFQNYIQYYWKNTLAPSFGTLTSTQTGFFKTGTGLNYGTINDAIARYDRVYYLHHNTYPTLITDFAGRNPATISGASVTPSSSQNNSSVFVLAGLSAIAVLAAGSYFFIRKKKAD
jgi:LPXTG-motif cell wall-anchored protein